MRAFSSAFSSSLIRSSKALIDGGAAGADIFAVGGRECGRGCRAQRARAGVRRARSWRREITCDKRRPEVQGEPEHTRADRPTTANLRNLRSHASLRHRLCARSSCPSSPCHSFQQGFHLPCYREASCSSTDAQAVIGQHVSRRRNVPLSGNQVNTVDRKGRESCERTAEASSQRETRARPSRALDIRPSGQGVQSGQVTRANQEARLGGHALGQPRAARLASCGTRAKPGLPGRARIGRAGARDVAAGPMHAAHCAAMPAAQGPRQRARRR